VFSIVIIVFFRVFIAPHQNVDILQRAQTAVSFLVRIVSVTASSNSSNSSF